MIKQQNIHIGNKTIMAIGFILGSGIIGILGIALALYKV